MYTKRTYFDNLARQYVEHLVFVSVGERANVNVKKAKNIVLLMMRHKSTLLFHLHSFDPICPSVQCEEQTKLKALWVVQISFGEAISDHALSCILIVFSIGLPKNTQIP